MYKIDFKLTKNAFFQKLLTLAQNKVTYIPLSLLTVLVNYVTEEYINNRYDYLTYSDNLKELKNNKLKIIYNNKYKSNIPYFSIVIPVYNQENIIVNNIIDHFYAHDLL